MIKTRDAILVSMQMEQIREGIRGLWDNQDRAVCVEAPPPVRHEKTHVIHLGDIAKNVETNLGASGASSAAELTSSSSRSPSSSKSTIEDADPSLYRAQKLREYHRKWDKIAADKEIMEEAEGEIKNVTRHNAPQQKNEADERKRKSSTKISMKESAARTAIAEKEKGNAYFSRGEYSNAIRCYTAAMLEDPSNPIYPNNRAMTYLKMERFEKAIADCERALALDRCSVKALLRRGTAHMRLGKYSSALMDFERARLIEPTNSQAKSLAADVRKKQKQDSRRVVDVSSEHGSSSAQAGEKRLGRNKQPKETSNANQRNTWKTDYRLEMKNVRRLCENSGRSVHKPSIVDVTDAGESDGNEANSPPEQNTPVTEGRTIQPMETEKVNNEKEKRNKNEKERDKRGVIEKVRGNAVSNSTHAEYTSEPSGMQHPFPRLHAKLPTHAPQTSFEFEKTWRNLRGQPDALQEYWRMIPPSAYPSLFKASMTSDVFSDVSAIIEAVAIDHQGEARSMLQFLSQVPRIDMMIMLMEDTDSRALRNAFNCLKAGDPNHEHREKDQELRSFFGFE